MTERSMLNNLPPVDISVLLGRYGQVVTMPLPKRTPRRILLEEDEFCPSCGHDRGGSVSSLDMPHGKMCQKCGATWREIDAK